MSGLCQMVGQPPVLSRKMSRKLPENLLLRGLAQTLAVAGFWAFCPPHSLCRKAFRILAKDRVALFNPR